ncbi:response regulator transcription factor [Garciella nitratireducens]|uniref:Stage 0 sporulation protein A homolog n=1 Tax=Garciella nitratireducens DSM 15102 TaxID=1121911 RepID=A0A1T4NSW4_9FIRM|nr:response regulator transcription factor [Garciella nitratireducens]RBP44751.1 two-component system response regulator VicR [Garciella nitratireducens]SJZ82126.1 two-component system, OmpR family, response regulator VicR [Garciella nitratireducens DSM 15102]
MNEKILVVDDEPSITDLIKLDLEFEGYQVETAYDGREALEKVENFHPDLIILDIMLPHITGYEVCRKVNEKYNIPIILLTAKTDIVDKVLGLELGADDYITKPFDNRELLARVKALIRRISNPQKEDNNEIIENGDLKIIPNERKVLLKDKEIHLTPKEYDLLYLLAQHPEQVFPRENLLEKIWGYDYFGDTRTVDMHIQRIRKKIGDHSSNPKYLQTVFGVGYKMRRV